MPIGILVVNQVIGKPEPNLRTALDQEVNPNKVISIMLNEVKHLFTGVEERPRLIISAGRGINQRATVCRIDS